jgi:quercetin dioxygenase-like cupin family protein
MERHRGQVPYTIQERKLVAETAGLRVQEMTLAKGESIPWHYHSNISDTFFCLQGALQIETPRPGEKVLLKPGDSLAVPPRQAHEVSNKGQGLCRFVLVQGVGTYDFVPVSHA